MLSVESWESVFDTLWQTATEYPHSRGDMRVTRQLTTGALKLGIASRLRNLAGPQFKMIGVELQLQLPGSASQEFHYDNYVEGGAYHTVVITATEHDGTEYPAPPHTATSNGWSVANSPKAGGNISRHDGDKLHRGPANDSRSTRKIIAVVFAADGFVDTNMAA